MIFADEILKKDIKDSFVERPSEELAGILADVLWTYVLEPQKVQESKEREEHEKKYDQSEESFAEFMQGLMAQYRFPEMRRFRIEGNRVFLMFHDQEIEIKGRMEDLPLKPIKKIVEKQPELGETSKQPDTRRDIKPGDNIRFENLEW
jgi:hypothetical protein